VNDLRSYREASADVREQMILPLASRLAPRFTPDWKPATELLPGFRDRQTGMRFLLVLGGRFQMGLSEREETAARRLCDPIPAILSALRPVRDVDIASFLMSETPVLWELAARVLDQRPTSNLSYPAFLSREEALKVVEHTQCRLATEQQWEYACRAGTTTLFVFGETLPPYDELDRWFGADFSDPSRVQANPFGLRGMFTGEWCREPFKETLDDDAPIVEGSHTIRGGGAVFWPWQDEEWVWCMSAMRMPSKDLADGTCGFRLVHDLPAEKE
jgi:formylglycine-generating enzyme required for sulfatase activity